MTIINKKAVTMYASSVQHQALLDLCLSLGFTDTRRHTRYAVPNLSAFFQVIADNADDPELRQILKRLKEKE